MPLIKDVDNNESGRRRRVDGVAGACGRGERRAAALATRGGWESDAVGWSAGVVSDRADPGRVLAVDPVAAGDDCAARRARAAAGRS